MAKKSLKVKQARKPKYSTRSYTRCNLCGRPHSVLRKFGGKGGVQMIVTDPIADMLTRIRNANKEKHKSVNVPASKMKKAIAEIMLNEGFIKSYEVNEEENVQGTIKIELKYAKNSERVIKGLRRISKPSLRVYSKYNELPKVLGGLGVALISTSKGLVTDKEARKLGVGGEVICYIW